MDLPSWADQILNDLGTDVNMEGLQAAWRRSAKSNRFSRRCRARWSVSRASATRRFAALMKVAGGVEALGSSAATYYQKFYDSGEQREAARKQIEKQLAAAGVQLPDIDASDARKQYRKLVEAQDLNTEAGRKAYAVLLQLAGAFDAVAVSSEEVARKQQAISDKRWDLEQRLLVAEGKNREALDMRRKQEYDALWKLDPELAKLVNRIWELEDAASAPRRPKPDASRIARTPMAACRMPPRWRANASMRSWSPSMPGARPSTRSANWRRSRCRSSMVYSSSCAAMPASCMGRWAPPPPCRRRVDGLSWSSRWRRPAPGLSA